MHARTLTHNGPLFGITALRLICNKWTLCSQIVQTMIVLIMGPLRGFPRNFLKRIRNAAEFLTQDHIRLD